MDRLTVRLPADLTSALDEYAEGRGLDRSQALRAVLREAALDPAAAKPRPPGVEELLSLLGQAARDGSVPAMKALLEFEAQSEPHPDPDDPLEQMRRRRRERLQGMGWMPSDGGEGDPLWPSGADARRGVSARAGSSDPSQSPDHYSSTRVRNGA